MKIFKTIKNNLETIYFVALSLFWVILFIYFRFIKEKTSYHLNDLKGYVTNYFIIINILFVLLHICLLCYAFYVIYTNNRVKKQVSLIHSMQNILNVIFIKPFITLHELIAPHIPYSGVLFLKITDILKNKNNLFLLKIPVILFNFLPRIIIASTFFIELLVYNRIYYFIYIAWLFLIILLWNLFVSLYISFAERLLILIPQYITITPVGEASENGWYSLYKFSPLPKYQYEDGDVQEYGETYVKAIYTHCFGAGKISFRQFHREFSPYIILLTSSLYVLAGFYKLIIILN